jgi:hypothetical protein
VVGTGAAVVRHAGGRYRKLFAWARHPVRAAEGEVHHLHQVERAGASGETPYIAMLGLALFLWSVLLLMLGVALAVYYLS